MVYSLNNAAALASTLGQSIGTTYTSVASTISSDLTANHYDTGGNFFFETVNRKEDGAVIHAIATFGKDPERKPTSAKTASTIKHYN